MARWVAGTGKLAGMRAERRPVKVTDEECLATLRRGFRRLSIEGLRSEREESDPARLRLPARCASRVALATSSSATLTSMILR